eukprot:TRINITY_DN3553_c0_g1_i2.p1 TRINITY_DN3553_c0_g1~~TRINITY_DN3553_c0_g1_i2.p1  ORF type:complete len:580 (+),score=148.88 TRINITY_DN3553_c0_g1_i2:239-1978(+)
MMDDQDWIDFILQDDFILLNIFELLSEEQLVTKVALVCKRWKEVIYEYRKEWKSLDLFSRVKNRNFALKFLNSIGGEDASKAIQMISVDYFRLNLKFLSISTSSIIPFFSAMHRNKEMQEHLIHNILFNVHFPRLISFTVEIDNHLPSPLLNNQTLSYLSSNCPLLECLKLSSFKGFIASFNGNQLSNYLSNSSIRSLQLKNVYIENSSSLLINKLLSLQRLEIEDVRMVPEFYPSCSNSNQIQLDKERKMQILKWNGIVNSKRWKLENMKLWISEIIHLDLSRNSIGDSQLNVIIPLCNQLRSCNLFFTHAKESPSLFHLHCPHLRDLNLASTPTTSESFDSLRFCTNLTALNATNTILSEANIMGLSRQLKSIHVSDCWNVTNESIQFLSMSHQINTIVCTRSPLVSSLSIASFSEKMGNCLRKLTFGGIYSSLSPLSDANPIIISLAQFCPLMEKIKLIACTFSEETTLQLISKQRNLRKLQLIEGSQRKSTLTKKIIQCISESCPNIETLCVNTLVFEEDLLSLASCKHLSSLTIGIVNGSLSAAILDHLPFLRRMSIWSESTFGSPSQVYLINY